MNRLIQNHIRVNDIHPASGESACASCEVLIGGSVVMDGCYCCPTVRRTGNHRLRCRKALILHLSATPLLMKLLKEKHLNCETMMYYGTMPSSFYMLNHPFAFITASRGCQRYFISTLNGCVTLKQLECENTSPNHHHNRFLKSFTLKQTAVFMRTHFQHLKQCFSMVFELQGHILRHKLP